MPREIKSFADSCETELGSFPIDSSIVGGAGSRSVMLIKGVVEKVGRRLTGKKTNSRRSQPVCQSICRSDSGIGGACKDNLDETGLFLNLYSENKLLFYLSKSWTIYKPGIHSVYIHNHFPGGIALADYVYSRYVQCFKSSSPA
jgi:hypothetical protein